MNKIGLIAGVGRLPVEFARAARGMGFIVIAAGVVLGIDPELKETVSEYHEIPAGNLDKLINSFKNAGVKEVTMLGKVTKELLFTGAADVDSRMKKLLLSLSDQSDDTIMLAIVKELFAQGFTVLDQTKFISALLLKPGVLTKRAPSEAEKADMEFGYEMAKKIGALDIGQTVVVKNRAVMAVEAIEGTDECIRRGGGLGKEGVTVAKAAKPQQDNRFDMPSVGPDTLAVMIEAKATSLIIEAGKTLVIDKDRVVEIADKHNITIVIQ